MPCLWDKESRIAKYSYVLFIYLFILWIYLIELITALSSVTASSSVSCRSDADELRNPSNDLKHPDQQAAGVKIWKCVPAHIQAIATAARERAGKRLSKRCDALKSPIYTAISNASRSITCCSGKECPGRDQGTLRLPCPHQHAAKQKGASWFFVVVML